MSSNGNGEKSQVIKFLVMALWLVVFTAITTIASNVISNDKESRTRDHAIENKAHVQQQKTQECLTDIKVILAELSTDIKYIKSNG